MLLAQIKTFKITLKTPCLRFEECLYFVASRKSHLDNKKYLKLLRGRHSQTFKIQREAREAFSSNSIGMPTLVSTEDNACDSNWFVSEGPLGHLTRGQGLWQSPWNVMFSSISWLLFMSNAAHRGVLDNPRVNVVESENENSLKVGWKREHKLIFQGGGVVTHHAVASGWHFHMRREGCSCLCTEFIPDVIWSVWWWHLN